MQIHLYGKQSDPCCNICICAANEHTCLLICGLVIIMNNLPQITDAEYEIMSIIWDKYPINTNEITNIAMQSNNWSIHTVHTLISRLDKKGIISHTQEGKMYYYTPVVKKEDYINAESKSFLKKFFNGTLKNMVMNLIDHDMLTDDELSELKKILNRRE